MTLFKRHRKKVLLTWLRAIPAIFIVVYRLKWYQVPDSMIHGGFLATQERFAFLDTHILLFTFRCTSKKCTHVSSPATKVLSIVLSYLSIYLTVCLSACLPACLSIYTAAPSAVVCQCKNKSEIVGGIKGVKVRHDKKNESVKAG